MGNYPDKAIRKAAKHSDKPTGTTFKQFYPENISVDNVVNNLIDQS